MTHAQREMWAQPTINKRMLPGDTELPFFAYGFLKPGEIAYPRLAEYVDRTSDAKVGSKRWLRDGLLLLQLADDGPTLHGSLLRFLPGQAQRAYDAIADLEPAKMYKWTVAEVTVEGSRESANVLEGAKVHRGGGREMEPREEWSSATDPMFSAALTEIERVIKEIDERESSVPQNPEDLGPFFREQMAYLLLWSSIERYASLRYRLSHDRAMDKVLQLAAERAFQDALHTVVTREDRIWPAHDPSGDPVTLNASNARGSLNYYYQVRSNVVHRGKAAIRDKEIIGKALRELLDIHRRVLETTLPRPG